MNTRKIAIAAALAAAALGSGVAQARGAVDVQWSVTVASPELRLPGGGVVYLPPIPLPRAVVVQPRHEVEYRHAPRHEVEYRHAPRDDVEYRYAPSPEVEYRLPPRHGGGYREQRHWDIDGDGIPNRYDRVYNPRWDRDGDGVPNRYDRTPGGGHDYRDYRDFRDYHDYRDRRDWRDERRDDHRDNRRDGRRD